MDPRIWEVLAGDADDEIAALIRIAPGGSPPAAVRIVARFGEIATCRVRRGDILAVREHPSIRSFKAPRDLVAEPALDVPPRAARPRARPRSLEVTGRGSVVGVIDWGCDFTHPNFLHANGRTRLLALWDQRPSRRRAPSPYGYGVVHDAAAIDRALAAADPFGALRYDHTDADVDDNGTHGTHVFDIAAGRPIAGRGGVAPGADLAFVHLAMHDRGPRNIANSVTLLEAIDFIARTAGPRPWVVNLSLGSHAGPHDGSTLVELALDACVTAGPGRVIVQSVGNYFRRPIHSTGQLRVGTATTINWLIDPTDETRNELDLWYAGPDRAIVRLLTPSGRVVAVATPDSHGPIVYQGRTIGRFGHRTADPNNGDNQVTLIVDPIVGGRWRVAIEPLRVERGDYHAWVERDEATHGSQSRISRAESSQQTTTNSISNGRHTITVGAYDPRDGTIAKFSSAGPTRDGRHKPDLVAPGVAICAARSSSLDGDRADLTIKSGTSMASPHVAGTVALLYEAAGRALAIDEVRTLLERTSNRLDGAHAHRSGWGRLDIEAAVASARALRSTHVPALPPSAPTPPANPPPANPPTSARHREAAYSEAEASATATIPVRRTVHSAGITYEAVDKKRTWVGGQEIAPQLTRAILTGLVPLEDLTDTLVTAAVGIIRNADWQGADVTRRAKDKQLIGRFHVMPSLAFALISWLELDHKITASLTADEIGRVERAVAVTLVWARERKNLEQLYPWMTERMLTAFAWNRRIYLDQLHAAIAGNTTSSPLTWIGSSGPGWKAWREQVMISIGKRDAKLLPWSPGWTLEEPLHNAIFAYLDAWHKAIEPFEAIREDDKLVNARGYRYLWKVKEGQQATPSSQVNPNELRRFLTYAWERKRSWAEAAINSEEARRKLLDGFAGYSNVASAEAPAETSTGALAYTPGIANAPPLPSSLATSPAVVAPDYLIPVGSEIRASMQLEFPDVYEAFGNFGYRWELLRIPEATIAAAVNRGNDLGFVETDEEAPGFTDVIGNQFDRRARYAKEDVKRVFADLDSKLGPASVGAASIVSLGAIAGFIGEVILSVFELLTAKRDEKRVALREPGIYIFRCIATPQISSDAARIRPPSAAYLPLWVRPVDEVADSTAVDRLRRLGKIPEQLGKLATALAESKDPAEREAIEQEIARLKLELTGTVDGVLDHAYRALDGYLKALKIPDQPLWLKRQTEEARDKAATQRDELLARILNRSRWYSAFDPDPPAQAQLIRLRGVLVTDDGVAIDLLADAWLDPKSQHWHVFDSTKKHSGTARAKHADPGAAIQSALRSLLDSSNHGYGRGHCTFYVVLASKEYRQSFRTTPDLEAALLHSFESSVQLATAVAMVVVVASGGAVGVGLLLPLAIVGAIPSLYRLVTKARDGMLGLDLATLIEIVDVVGSLAGLGQTAAGALKMVKLSRGLMIMGLGTDAAGGIMLAAEIADQIAMTANIQPPAARRAEITRLLAGAFQSIGMIQLGKAAGRYAEARRAEALGVSEKVLDRAPLPVNQRLAELVGADFPVHVDTDAATTRPEIRLEADGYGLPSKLQLVLPEGSTEPKVVEAHARPIRTLLDIERLAGGVRKLVDKVETYRVRGTKLPDGSRAGDAAHQIEGAPKQLFGIAEDVATARLDAAKADERVAAIGESLGAHTMTFMELDAGPAFVEARQPTEARAVASGYDKAPAGHYVIDAEPQPFALRRVADSTAPPHHYDDKKKAVVGTTPAPATSGSKSTSRRKAVAYDPAVTAHAASQRLGRPVRIEGVRGQKDIRIKPQADGSFVITAPKARGKVTHQDVIGAVERRLVQAKRPDAPHLGPSSRRVRGRKPLWSGEEEAAFRGYPPAEDGYHWVWRGNDIDHYRQPGVPGKRRQYDSKKDRFVDGGREEARFTSNDDPMGQLGADNPTSPFGMWVATVTGGNGVLRDVLGIKALPRPDGKGPVTREWLAGLIGGDPTGKTHAEVLAALKRPLQPTLEAAIRDIGSLKQRPHYQDLWDRAARIDPAKADLVIGHRALLDLTKGLHPVDGGRVANRWVLSEVLPTLAPKHGIFPEVTVPQSLVDELGLDGTVEPRLDALLVADVTTGVEVKHGRAAIIHADPVFAAKNQHQWNVFSRLIGNWLEVPRIPTGGARVDAMLYTLTHPEGVLTNAGWIARQLHRGIEVDFVLFDHARGARTWKWAEVQARVRGGLTQDTLLEEIRAFINGPEPESSR